MNTATLAIADDQALGGSVRVIVTEPGSLAAAKHAVDLVLFEIDAAASRFRADSELSRLNRRAGEVVKVSPMLARAIAAAIRGAELSDGAVDPTIGTAIRLAGYDADFASLATDDRPLRLIAKRVPGWRGLYFGPDESEVMVPHGVELDLGATAKALAADLAAAAGLRATARGGVLVSLGGDIAVAGEAPDGGWRVQVSEDSAADLEDGEETIRLMSGAVATSGTTVRRWTRGGIELHHIIDPATGLPTENYWRTATVTAASCVDANIASTAAIVMGETAIPWLERNRLQARLVAVDGTVHRIGGWPDANSER